MIKSTARAIAFAVHSMPAGTFNTFRAFYDNLAAVIETVARALTIRTFRFDTMGTETGGTFYIAELHSD